jgi:hypothetical protein
VFAIVAANPKTMRQQSQHNKSSASPSRLAELADDPLDDHVRTRQHFCAYSHNQPAQRFQDCNSIDVP